MHPTVRWLRGLLACAALAGGFALWSAFAFTASGPLERAKALVIPKGLGVEGIGRQLALGGVIERPWLFALGVRVLGNHRTLRAGEYEFPARASAEDAMAILIYAKPVVRRLTVPEGLTSFQALDQIARTDGLEGTLTEVPLEGSLLPETYNFSWGDGRNEILARMQKAMSETLEALWQARAPGLPLKTPEEALVLASMVEKETGKPEERARVAAVFLNRLRRHMRLQSDPTVAYALAGGKGPLGRPLSHADLESPSRYNTYLIDGLPPAPIANPGRASLLAALHPADTDELYFVADGAGGHSFAKSLDEHNRNVARLRQLQNATGAPKAE